MNKKTYQITLNEDEAFFLKDIIGKNTFLGINNLVKNTDTEHQQYLFQLINDETSFGRFTYNLYSKFSAVPPVPQQRAIRKYKVLYANLFGRILKSDNYYENEKEFKDNTSPFNSFIELLPCDYIEWLGA